MLVHGWGMSVPGVGHRAAGAARRRTRGGLARPPRPAARRTRTSRTRRSRRSPLTSSLSSTICRSIIRWSTAGRSAAPSSPRSAGKLGDQLGGLVLTCGATPRYVQDDDYPHGGTVEALDATMAALGADRAGFLAGLSAGVCHADVGQPVIDWMWQIFMQASPRADAALRDLGNVDHRALLPTIDAPALVIGGTHDAIVPFGIAEVAAELLPAAPSSSSRRAATPRSSRRTPATATSSCASPARSDVADPRIRRRSDEPQSDRLTSPRPASTPASISWRAVGRCATSSPTTATASTSTTSTCSCRSGTTTRSGRSARRSATSRAPPASATRSRTSSGRPGGRRITGRPTSRSASTAPTRPAACATSTATVRPPTT